MHALTVRQPHAKAIMSGEKSHEYRNFRPKNITEFALHAGATRYPGHDGPYGAILGIVRIVEIEPAEHVTANPYLLAYGKWAWRLEVVEVFDEPIPARGRPGFWKWDYDDKKAATTDSLLDVIEATRLLLDAGIGMTLSELVEALNRQGGGE